MNKVLFDYKIDLLIITQENNNNFDIYDIDYLKGFFNGRIYIFFDYDNHIKRNFIMLETGILDYILQFDMFFSYALNDKEKINLVSCDYYSNSLDFLYYKENNNLEISEVNSALYTISCNYNEFRKAYEKFRKKTLDELVVFYPQLKKNKYFIEYFIDIKNK